MYRPASTVATNLNYSSRNLSAHSNTFNAPQTAALESESDLSDADEAPNVSSISSHPEAQEIDQISQDQKTSSDSSHEEDAAGSDDAEYDMETPPPADHSLPHDELSSSDGSRRQTKRKTGAEQDDFMMNDPELYGLRRSVCSTTTSLETAPLTHI